ncbi:pyridoxamine 5'-phosphate oxidase family protein [Sutcliffiella rhizosphaerae]|uniref:Pyridoxamine 5'-phosphate oxidase N-terminal domain-containing protein n=1 Tax=Sutcliffiella rhizosphaerae TaxID=2880967 RepID=A0ABN8A4C6_9BACI|nr:pyridoxamine 5'-phosphate oxidase family protein [Sutcliffiella rhizosphaerae]CAG9619859.1 hypothetical protein BACCIP111883_00627 [Sutcliffiella rhizosphaerae]
MPNLVENVLIDPLITALQKELLVTISTVDHETGGPNVSAVSWLYAMDARTILLAVNASSRIVDNILHHHNLVVNVMANESVYAIYTQAKVKQKRMENVPLNLSLLQLNIQEVRDVMFYGAKISSTPAFEKTYDLEAAKKLDQQVMDSLRKFT